MKDATGDLQRMRRTRALAGAELSILSGDDELTLAMMRDPEIRASGCISVMSNIAPAAVQAMVTAQAAGQVAQAEQLATKLAPLFRMVTIEASGVRVLPHGRSVEVVDKFRNPAAVKTMMAGLGMVTGATRRPLGKMSKRAVAACREALSQLHASAPEILAPIERAFSVSLRKQLADDAVWSALARPALH